MKKKSGNIVGLICYLLIIIASIYLVATWNWDVVGLILLITAIIYGGGKVYKGEKL